MFKLNKTSQIVTLYADISSTTYETKLNEEGLTGGYKPVKEKSMARCIDERIPNHYFLKYGGIEELVVGGHVELADHHTFPLKIAPRSSTGPDLKKIIIGNKSNLGQFTDASLKVFPLWTHKIWGEFILKDNQNAFKLFRNIHGNFIKPLLAGIFNLKEGVKLVIQLNGLKEVVLAEKEVISALAQNLVYETTWKSENDDELEKMVFENRNQFINLVAPFFEFNFLNKDKKIQQFMKKYFEGMHA